MSAVTELSLLSSPGPSAGAPQPRFARPELFPDYTEVSDVSRLVQEPVVSVLMGAYAHEQFIEQAIESVATQRTEFPFELIVAEDCSPDATRERAVAMARMHPEIVRVVFTPRNLGGARNALFAIGFCRGEFIAYCEGDDFWTDEHKLARQVAALRRHKNADMAFTRGYRCYENGDRILDWDYGEDERVVPLRELFGGQGWVAPTASLMYRRDILLKLPEWFEEGPVGDVVINAAGSVRGGACYDPRPTVCYRVAHRTSFTVELDSASRESRILFLERMIRLWERVIDHYGVDRRDVAHRIADYRLALARLEMSAGRWAGALKTFVRVSPAFLVRGLSRRLKRLPARHRAGDDL